LALIDEITWSAGWFAANETPARGGLFARRHSGVECASRSPKSSLDCARARRGWG